MTNRILHQVALAGGQVGGFSMYKFSHGQMFSFLLGVYLGVELVDHMVTTFNLLRTARLFFREAALFCFHQQCMGIAFISCIILK